MSDRLFQYPVFAAVIDTDSVHAYAGRGGRKQKTDQLILTSPVSIGGIVAGKYLAMATVFTIPVAVMALFPLI